MSRDLRQLTGLAAASVVVFGALAAAAKPVVQRKVGQWADEDRWVSSESGSSRPGKWRNATTPYAIEPMACLDADDPARTVTVKAAAQMLKSELFLNWSGQTICDDPAPMMLVLPSLEELRAWNATKWQPTVDATPALKGKVFELVERARTGSTTNFKKFKGGFLQVTTAMSSKGLQGRSIKRLCCDEISEFPADAGGRGDPIKQAVKRGDAHEDFKALYTSTPKNLPGCRVTAMYEDGDQRRYFVACPHCGVFQHLVLERFAPPEDGSGRVAYRCLGCEAPIDEIRKSEMLAGGRWIRTYIDRADEKSPPDPENPEPPDCFPRSQLARWTARGSAGRDPSFHIWQAYSPFKSWSLIWKEYQEAKRDVETGKDPDALKVFTQQTLGEAFDPATEAPNHQKLFEARGKYVKRGEVPGWACEILGAADVQGDRIEWDAYAIGPDLSMARFDWGVIEHDPLDPEAWTELAAVTARRWDGENTVSLGFDLFGVDLGGKKGVTERVYRFVRGRHNVVAVKGASDPDEVPLRKGKRKRIRLRDGTTVTIEPHLIGTWGLKSVVYSMLATSLDAKDARLAGGLYNPADATHEDFKSYASEVFKKPKTLRANARGWWEQIPAQPNERLDCAVYARALAWFRGSFTRTPAEWRALFEARAKRQVAELPLFGPAAAPAPEPETPNPTPRPSTARSGPRSGESAGSRWFRR